MNYQNVYDRLISKRQQSPLGDSVYGEKHHILPKSLGGTDDKANIVKLSAREHFVAHLLLCKIHSTNACMFLKMIKAVMMMSIHSSCNPDRYFNSRAYDSIRQQFSTLLSKKSTGKQNTQYGTMWIHHIKTSQAKKIKKGDKIPFGWQAGRVPKKIGKLTLKKQAHREKYSKLFIEFANGQYKSILHFATDKQLSKTNEPLNRYWNDLFPELKKFKNNKKFSSEKARLFISEHPLAV